jgi:hypothetical protein
VRREERRAAKGSERLGGQDGLRRVYSWNQVNACKTIDERVNGQRKKEKAGAEIVSPWKRAVFLYMYETSILAATGCYW